MQLMAGFGLSDKQFVETIVEPAEQEAENLLIEVGGDREEALSRVREMGGVAAGDDGLRYLYLSILSKEVNVRRRKK